MDPNTVLTLNGDFVRSPLLDTARRLHLHFARNAVCYSIIGGLAVVRNGAVRTTVDVDVLLRREEWARVRTALAGDFETGIDRAQDRKNGVEVDIHMVIPLPDPEAASEYDEKLGARFLTLKAVLELKTAVYLQRKQEEGIELAAKDLADVVALIQANPGSLSAQLIATMHPRVGRELRRIGRKLPRRRG
jgi:hypothetical protein